MRLTRTRAARSMDGKREDGYLLGVSPLNSTPPRSTLAQLAEERLGSLQYLLQSKNGVTASPPSRNRPRASTATPTGGGTNRAAGRVRRSTSGNVGEDAAVASASRSRGLFSSAPNAASRERPRSQGSSGSGRRQQASGSGKSNGNSTYRLSIDNNLERAPMGSSHVDSGPPSSSAWTQRSQPPASSSSGLRPERGAADAAGLAAPRQARGGVATGFPATATTGGEPARNLSGGSFYGGGDRGRGSYGGVGILEKEDGEDSDSFFGYSDDDDDGDGGGSADYSYHRRRRLQNTFCIMVGVSWAAALLLCVGASAGSAWSLAATLEAAAGCALLGIVILAALARFWGLPAWPQEDDSGDGEAASWCLWGRRRKVDEGGKLAEIDGVTYLAI